MKRYFKFFASILLFVLCLMSVSYAQTKIDWKQIKNIPDTLEFKNVLLEHLLFKSAYQPVMESIHMGGIYYDNQLERLRVYEHGQWRDLSVTIASDSIGAPLTILGYLQATDIYASRSAYIGKDVNVKGNVNASGTSTFNYLKVNNALKVPTVASKTLGVGSIYYDTTAKQLKVLNPSNNWDIVSIAVDNAMSATSTNPVQNKVIYNKFDNFEANVAQELQQTLIDAYNYANGIATQAYNYTNSVATQTKNYADGVGNAASNSAYMAARSYADTQIQVVNNTIMQVNTNMLASLSEGLNAATETAALYVETASAALNTQTLNDISVASAALNTQFNNAISSYSLSLVQYIDNKFGQAVTDIATGTASGTFNFTKNGTTTAVKIKGLGDAAFTNVASISSSIGGNVPSSVTPPSNPSPGQMYFDPTIGTIKFWTGDNWSVVSTPKATVYDDVNNCGYREYSDGWMECWGYKNAGANDFTVVFPNGGFLDTKYALSASGGPNIHGGDDNYLSIQSRTNTSFYVLTRHNSCYWYACGFKNNSN